MAFKRTSAGAVAVLAAASSLAVARPVVSQAATCPVGRQAVTNVGYAIFDPDGTSHNATRLSHNVDSGDQVNVLFNVPPLPATCSDVTLSIAAYESPVAPRHTTKLVLFSSQTGSFIAGGRYEMSATIAPVTSPGTLHWEIAFATGPVLAHPDYDANLIDTTHH